MTAPDAPSRAAPLLPLYLAGFTTAFGAHAVAAALGTETDDLGLTLFSLGLILALYDIAEVVLKPVFGALSDRIGIKPVIVAGLVVFALASLLGVVASTPALLAAARLGQGAAASAFSPASSAGVARLAPPGAGGRYFGRYGSWKGLGYAIGPLLGGVLILWAGLPALFAVLAILSAAAAVWVTVALPGIPPIPKPRATLAELVRQSTAPSFLRPVLFLATATAALGVAVGFLPLVGTQLGLDPIGSTAAVSALAVVSAVLQPRIGRWHDAHPRRATALLVTGTALSVAGLAAAAVAAATSAPAWIVVYLSALLIGAGVGLVTPVGFATLAADTPPARMGRTMGSAELGREVGDAGGPILVGVVAAATSLAVGLGALAAAAAVVGGAAALLRRGAGAATTPPGQATASP